MSDTSPQPFDTFSPDDLVAAVMVIDAACDNGAFKGWDNIQKAFTIRNRLLKFAEQWNTSISPAPTPEEGNPE